MKNKSLFLFSASVSLLILASYTVYKTSGSHPGSTGAPGELTCAQVGCHANAPVTQDNGIVNTLLFSSNDTTYIPGNTYTLTLQVVKAPLSKFGFELVALKDSTNTNIGSFGLLESTRTQQISHMAPGNDLRFSMTHKSAGTTTASPGAIQWKMKWTAPATNVGTITFWYATNCTNNNGQATGDGVFLSHFQIRPAAPEDTTGGGDTLITGINKYEADMDRLRAYQEAQSDYLSVNFSSYETQQGKIEMYDVTGKLLLTESVRFVPGHNNQRIHLPSNCCEGAYLVKVYADNRSYTNKIILTK